MFAVLLLPISPPRAPRPVASLAHDDDQTVSVAGQAAQLASKLRREIEDAEEELHVEVEHSKKFLLRGRGLREDFATSRRARRKALLRATADNEAALVAAMRDAKTAGLPQEYLEEAVRVANAVAVARAEIEWDAAKLGDSADDAGGSGWRWR
mmetsp:Transcript_46852/g.138296  ORF Transcript_46852/g.138296 Transcript_46852/m.138296 type:complete len:153 (-) Transcript_46852:70-528(-)